MGFTVLLGGFTVVTLLATAAGVLVSVAAVLLDVAAVDATGAGAVVVLWASPKAMRETIAGRGLDLGGTKVVAATGGISVVLLVVEKPP